MTMTSETPTLWLTITAGTAGKLGRNGGEVGYLLLRDHDSQHLAVTIQTNSGGGCWSQEIVSLDAVERCLPDDRQQPIPTKVLARSFSGGSANNAPFLAAVLLATGFLSRSTEQPNRFQIADNWSDLKSAKLALPATEPYVPPVKEGKRTASSEPAEAISAMTSKEMPGQVEADDDQKHRKGKKGGVRKHAEHGHANAATV
jgi:hypothetical protein